MSAGRRGIGRAMTKRYRWTCAGGHPGILAPGRLRARDVRRFCWQCSEAAGVLVERTCPALDKARQARQERRRQSAKRKAANARKARHKAAEGRLSAREAAFIVPGLGPDYGDLRDELTRLCALPCVETRMAANEREIPTLSVRRRDADYTTGHSWHDGRITMTIPRDCRPPAAAVLLAHELAHSCCDLSVSHGEPWRRAFVEILVEGYDLPIGGWPRDANGRRVDYPTAHQAFELIAASTPEERAAIVEEHAS